MEINFQDESEATAKKLKSVSFHYLSFVKKRSTRKNRTKQKALKQWKRKDNDVESHTPPAQLMKDQTMGNFLRSEFDRATSENLKHCPHMRKTHGVLSNWLRKNNLPPFLTAKKRKLGLVSHYPETEKLWKGMLRHDQIAR